MFDIDQHLEVKDKFIRNPMHFTLVYMEMFKSESRFQITIPRYNVLFLSVQPAVLAGAKGVFPFSRNLFIQDCRDIIIDREYDELFWKCYEWFYFAFQNHQFWLKIKTEASAIRLKPRQTEFLYSQTKLFCQFIQHHQITKDDSSVLTRRKLFKAHAQNLHRFIF